MLAWKRKQDEIARAKAAEERRIAEEEAMKAAIEKEAELKAAAIEKGEDPANVIIEVPIVPEIIEAPVKLSSKNSSGLTTARRKDFNILDANLIPREYLMPDTAKIKAERMKYDFEAKSTIPGVEFTFNENVR